MNIHYFRDGYCHRARCRNINSAPFAAARGKVAKERWRRERRRVEGEERAQYPTLFHFTVDPVASFRSLELDLIKIRAGEALTPPIKSPNHSRCRPRPRRLSAKTAILPARDIQHRSAGVAYIKAEPFARI